MLEKAFYIFICIILICLYKSKWLQTYLFVEIPHISLSLSSVIIIILSWGTSYLDRLTDDMRTRSIKIKEKLKDTKRLLLHHMDPLVVETLKEIVRNDMKDEMFRMRNSADGCSQKCKLVS